MSRISFSIEDILKEIPGSPDSVGYDVSLSKIYDDIKEARFEEDDRLSQGIWERDLKKADWILVEKLTLDAIQNKTKDLQIVGWLMESLAILDGFDGISKGIDILSNFIEKFWEYSYPRTDENISDTEQKFRILNWIYEITGKKSLFVPFSSSLENENINLYNYDYALELKTTASRSPKSSNEIIESARNNNIKTIEEIQKIIKLTDQTQIQKIENKIEKIKISKNKFDEVIKVISEKDSIGSFLTLINNLEKIEKILSHKAINNKPANSVVKNTPSPESDSFDITRDEIYNELDNLSKKLKTIEKHSPSYSMIQLVVSWRDKTLLEIIDDLKSGNSESNKLLKFLLS